MQKSGAETRKINYALGNYRFYDLVIAGFVVIFTLSNISATKLIELGSEFKIGPVQIFPIITDGGAVLFPMAYIFGDILAEVYGLARAKRAIFTGFGASLLASITFLIVDALPSATGWDNGEAWHSVLGFVARIVCASLAGYLVGQLLNAWVLVKIKEHTSEKSLWVRLLGSTIVGELADTVLFCAIAYGGLIGTAEILNYIAYGYIYKVAVEAVFLPITAKVIGIVKRHEPDYFSAEQTEPKSVEPLVSN